MKIYCSRPFLSQEQVKLICKKQILYRNHLHIYLSTSGNIRVLTIPNLYYKMKKEYKTRVERRVGHGAYCSYIVGIARLQCP